MPESSDLDALLERCDLRILARAIEQSPLSVLIADRDDVILYANPHFEAITGYARAEVIGRTPELLRSGHHPPEFYADLRATVCDGRTWHGEIRDRRRDGTEFWQRTSVAPVFDASGAITHFVALGEDVSDRIAARTAVREAMARYQAMFDAHGLVKFIIDPRTGTIVDANAAADRYYGFGPGQLVGRAVHELNCLSPEEIAQAMALARDGSRSVFAFRHRLASGELRDVEVRSSAVTIDGRELLYSLVTDVTEARRAARALAETQALYQGVVEHSPVGIYVLDGERVRYANPRFLEIVEMTAEQVYALPSIYRLLTPDSAARAMRLSDARRHGLVDKTSLQLEAFTGTGRRIVVQQHGTVARLHGERVLLGSVLDVTEQVQLEEQLRHSQKMEAVGQLAGGVAHDFNNLLTVILGAVELLQGEQGPPGRAQGDLAEIRHAATRAAALTRQLLTFSRRQATAPRRLDLNTVVADAEKLLRRLTGENLLIDLACHPAPCPVVADAGQLEQVLVNLVVNARDAMPHGGIVTIRTAHAPPPSGAPAGTGRWVSLVVEDTGHGIDDAVRERIFEPFFTTKGPGRGTGLGLATVYGIVTAMGGRIAVESAPGQGTTFSIVVPRAEGAVEAEPAPAPPPAATAHTVLLVEDERGVRVLMRRILERAGHVVHEARHGVDALLVWDSLGGHVDVLVTDIRMPEMDGHELVARLRERRPDLPVVTCSGYDAGVPEESAGDGRWHVQKPFVAGELLAAIHEATREASPTS